MGKSKAEIKRFAVLDTGAVVDLETYGMGSWGSNDQYGLKVKGGKVYETHWSYGGEWEEDAVGEALLGTIVYSSDKPLRILESGSSPTAAKRDFAEYGADLGKAFGTKQTRESRKRNGGSHEGDRRRQKETKGDKRRQNEMKKEKTIMKALERLTPAVGWSPFDHRANQKALGNLGTLEKMADYLLGKLSEDSAIAEGNDDREHCDITFKKRKALERLRDKYFKGERADGRKEKEGSGS